MLFRRYIFPHYSARDEIWGSNSNNENEKAMNTDEKNEKNVFPVINERSKYTNKGFCMFSLQNEQI